MSNIWHGGDTKNIAIKKVKDASGNTTGTGHGREPGGRNSLSELFETGGDLF